MVYRTTLTPLFTLRREMDRLFDDAFGRGATSPASWTPAVDVREETTGFVFDLELPGVDPKQVEVNTDNGVLTVSGEKHAERRDEGGEDGNRWHIVERVTGAFRRTFQLPQNVKEDAIEATFANGVLTVRVPKAEVPKPKRIEVRAK
ncbi:MAG: Hsp20/alpha crystallin family protein [Gemmatimonadota bacterium]|nr:Hsp20/alpha crystallin family protein [Gemmatimonadota bacterium]